MGINGQSNKCDNTYKMVPKGCHIAPDNAQSHHMSKMYSWSSACSFQQWLRMGLQDIRQQPVLWQRQVALDIAPIRPSVGQDQRMHARCSPEVQEVESSSISSECCACAFDQGSMLQAQWAASMAPRRNKFRQVQLRGAQTPIKPV